MFVSLLVRHSLPFLYHARAVTSTPVAFPFATATPPDRRCVLPAQRFLDKELDRHFGTSSQTSSLIESREEPLLRSYDLAMKSWRMHLFSVIGEKIVAACIDEVRACRHTKGSRGPSRQQSG